MAKLSFLIAFSLFVTTVVSQDFSEFEKLHYLTPTDTLPYRLLTPKTVDENKQYPLVLFLHGKGERGNDNIQSLKHIAPLFLKETNLQQFPCFVVVPQCPSNEEWTYPNWYQEPKNPISTVIKLIDSLSNLPHIDKTRVYVTGLSMGGFGTWYLLSKFPEKFAAAIPICGGGDVQQIDNLKHIPIWAFHGSRDDVVLPEQSRKMIKAIKKVGGTPKYTEYKRIGHDSWTKAYSEPDLLPWLFTNSL